MADAPSTTDGNKTPWKSKTVWISVISAVVPLIYPPAASFIAENPQLIMGGIGALFAGLRLISHGKIAIK